jgi:Cu2+-exporting ATPase
MIVAALALTACSAEVATSGKECATDSKPAAQPTKEEPVKATKLQYEMKVSGMMCEHCQATVTKLITSVQGVESAQVDYKTGVAIVTTKPGAKLSESALREAVDKDYTVESIHAIAQ